MKVSVTFLVLTSTFLGITGHLHLDWDPKYPAFDPSFYEKFLDPDLCQEHLSQIKNEATLALKFLESGLRIPRGISEGNLIDFGNYFQCLNINENVGSSNIEGKFCSINVPVNQNLSFSLTRNWTPEVSQWIDFDPNKLKIDKITIENLKKVKNFDTAVAIINGQNKNFRSLEGTTVENLQFKLAVCVPKTCTTQEWINGLVFNLSEVGFQYTENYCRVIDDKPWVPADYVAVVVFSLIGLLTLLSTSYDIWQTLIVKTDPKQINPIHRSFSLYTNARRLGTFTKNPSAIECLDGIRAISIMWIIWGHAFSTLPQNINVIEALQWIVSIDSTLVTASFIGVDTFFMMSGMLLVYTTAGKFTGKKLLKNLHVFYLNRLLRMFPLLAAAVLIQASFLYRLSDGPDYKQAARETEKCRLYWWSTLLYVQNYFNTLDMCLGHTWYLAVDMHMYILSPLILFWVLGGKKTTAWISMATAFICFLVSSTVYNFIMEFPASPIHTNRNDEYADYMTYYYVNTFTRATPFLIGMMFGYLLHLWRDKKVILSKFTIILLWVCAIVLIELGVFSGHPMKGFDYENQFLDSFVNSFSRPVWAIGVGWVVVACVHGYAGPINWFLSLQIWKMPSRLSYGMYLYHFQIMFVTAGSVIAPIYFSQLRVVYRFIFELSTAFMVSYVLTLFIDSPFSSICKLFLGGGPKKPKKVENKKDFNDNTMNRPIVSTIANRKHTAKL